MDCPGDYRCIICSGVLELCRSGVFSFEEFLSGPLKLDPLIECVLSETRLGEGLILGLVIDFMLRFRS